MPDSRDPIRVSHFSDALCVWAYIAQARVDELRTHFEDDVRVRARYVGVFGDTAEKIGQGWADRGGFEGYADHVREVVARFEHVEIHPSTWSQTRPASSMLPHLFASAVELVADQVKGEGGQRQLGFDFAWALRQAFFAQGRDIGCADVCFEVAAELEIPAAEIRTRLDDGRAHAKLSADLRAASEKRVEVSPTLVFNEGRQTLAGNVGYRIIEANIRELLDQATDGRSWC